MTLARPRAKLQQRDRAQKILVDHESIFRNSAVRGPEVAAVASKQPIASLEETAERDLEATLQLLAERAKYLTAASGVTIAVREGNEMICRASAGASAPQTGTPVALDSGLVGEAVRTRQTVSCDDVENGSRLREDYRALGTRSVIAIPLMRDQEIAGVFELGAERPHAFEERDVTALNRLSEMILTALDHAEAAKRAMKEISAAGPAPVASEPLPEAPTIAPVLKEEPPESAPEPALVPVRRCEACGFPISEGRTICLDCEEAGRTGESRAAGFLSQFTGGDGNQSWLEDHMYTLATLLIVALTVVLLALKLR